MDVFFHHLGIVGGNGPLSGASCGALIAVFTRCGLPVEIVVRLTRAFAQVWCADRLLKRLHDTCMPLAHWKQHPCSPKPPPALLPLYSHTYRIVPQTVCVAGLAPVCDPTLTLTCPPTLMNSATATHSLLSPKVWHCRVVGVTF